MDALLKERRSNADDDHEPCILLPKFGGSFGGGPLMPLSTGFGEHWSIGAYPRTEQERTQLLSQREELQEQLSADILDLFENQLMKQNKHLRWIVPPGKTRVMFYKNHLVASTKNDSDGDGDGDGGFSESPTSPAGFVGESDDEKRLKRARSLIDQELFQATKRFKRYRNASSTSQMVKPKEKDAQPSQRVHVRSLSWPHQRAIAVAGNHHQKNIGRGLSHQHDCFEVKFYDELE